MDELKVALAASYREVVVAVMDIIERDQPIYGPFGLPQEVMHGCSQDEMKGLEARLRSIRTAHQKATAEAVGA